MVARSDLLSTITIVSSLLLDRVDDVITSRKYTNPPWVGTLGLYFQNFAYYSNWYTLLSSISSASFSIVFGVYADVTTPLIGVFLTSALFVITEVISVTIYDFNLVDEDDTDPDQAVRSSSLSLRIVHYLGFMIPLIVLVVVYGITLYMQYYGAARRSAQRRASGMSPIDEEKRLLTDPLERIAMATTQSSRRY